MREIFYYIHYFNLDDVKKDFKRVANHLKMMLSVVGIYCIYRHILKRQANERIRHKNLFYKIKNLTLQYDIINFST